MATLDRYSEVHATLAVSIMPACVVRGCVPVSGSSSLIDHFWFLTPSLHSDALPPPPLGDEVGIPMKTEACLIGVYFNFARHTSEPYRKLGSPIGHVWWLTNDQAISYASRNGKI